MSVDPPIVPEPEKPAPLELDRSTPPFEPVADAECDRSDPRLFFRLYYSQRGGPPKGKSTEPEVQAYLNEFQAKTTKSKADLKDIAKSVRANMRTESQIPDRDDGEDPSLTISSSVGLISTTGRKIAFGAFISVALAVLGAAAYYLNQNRSWEQMRPFAIGVIALAGILLLLSFSVVVLRGAPLGDWPKRAYAVFAMIVSGALILVLAGWFSTHIARDAGWLGPVEKLVEKPPQPRAIVNPPSVIGFNEANSYENNAILKDEIFGSLQNDRGRPREWMRDLEYGAQVWLNDKDVVYSWLLVKEKEKSNTSFTAHVYSGTQDDIVILGFLLETREFNDIYKATVLPLMFKPESKNKELYKFAVPDSKEPGQLLIFIAMKSETAKKWQQDRKSFTIQKEMN